MAGEVLLILALAAGAVLAILTGRKAHQAYQVTRAPSLRFFFLGFYLLAASQACALLLQALVGSAPVALDRGSPDHFDVVFWAHYLTLLVGIVSVFRSFGRHPFRWAPAMAPVLLLAGPLLQLLVVIFLFFLVLHAGFNHISRKAAGSLRVSLGFFFIMLGHIGNLSNLGAGGDYAPLEPRLWWAELVTLLGFSILYFSIGSTRKVADA